MLGLLIAAGAFGASTIYLGMQLDEERDRADQYLEESRALNTRIAELERVRAELEALRLENAALPAEPPAAAAMPPPSGPHIAQALPAAEPVSADTAARSPRSSPLERSEASRKMMRAQIRGNNKRLYADIGARLGLTPDEANKLIDLITDQQVGALDRMRRERANAAESVDRGALVEKIQQENLAQISDLIGAGKMDLYRQYQDTLPARQEVETLSRQLDGNDLGLSKDQRDRMVTALSEERQRVPAPKFSEAASREEYNRAMATWQDDYHQRAAARAGSILSGDQLTAYSEYQKWSREMRQQAEQRRSNRETAGLPPGSAPTPR
jgi:hypothetical protein